MAKRGRGDEVQPTLFGGGDGADADWGRGSSGDEGVEVAGVSERLERVGEGLPGGVRLGTSTWSFPGWEGIVYGGRYSADVLARRGLSAYGGHPLLRAVGVDRTFYRPVSAERFAGYAGEVPGGFRFLVKAHRGVVMPVLSEDWGGPAGGGANPDFLDASVAVRDSVEPAVEGLGEKLGVVLFQFPPMSSEEVGEPERFIGRLHGFLSRMPRGVPVGVELRNAELVCDAYAGMLADLPDVSHCYVEHPSAAGLGRQLEVVPVEGQPRVVCRWMLGRGRTYRGAKARYEPFDRMVDPDGDVRRVYARVLARAVVGGLESVLIANNKAEGSAPLTVFALAEALVEEVGRVKEGRGDTGRRSVLPGGD